MTGKTRVLQKLRRDERGATLVEFALILLPLSVLILGFTDLGYRSYLTSVVQGTLNMAAREATLGNKSGDDIDRQVKARLDQLTDPRYVTITKKSYSSFSGVNKPEKLTYDLNGNGAYDKADKDCYEDANDSTSFNDSTSSGRNGLGNAEDIIYYEVSVTFPRIVPMTVLGWSAMETIKANTVMQNQPFAKRVKPAVRCGD